MRYLLVFSFLAFCSVSSAQIIDFPDANFKNALVNTLCVDTNDDGTPDADADLNNDGEITQFEASSIKSLQVNNQNITSVGGVGLFRNLISLNCSDNKITSLNIGLNSLKYLDCSNNKIHTLFIGASNNLEYFNISNNNYYLINMSGFFNLLKLKTLICSGNSLEVIDFTNFKELEYFDFSSSFTVKIELPDSKYLKTILCSNNRLTELKLDKLINLKELNCSFNKIKTLDLHNNTNLIKLNCSSNNINTIDLNYLENLQEFICNYNSISSLNLSSNTNLEYLDCSSSSIYRLNLKNTKHLQFIFCHSNYILDSIDLSHAKKLKYINVESNQISYFNTTGLRDLKRLECGYNNIKSLNLDSLINLSYLSCATNNIDKLNLDNIVMIDTLDCSNNKLKELIFNKNYNLKYLKCNANILTQLDLRKTPNLTYLKCDKNKLVNLWVEGCHLLDIVDCSSNLLTNLNLESSNKISFLKCSKNNVIFLNIKSKSLNVEGIDFSQNSDITYICCDVKYMNDIFVKTINYGLKNTEINSYCSFTPGGKFYILNGQNKYDANINGCEEDDIKWPNLKYEFYQDNNLTGLYIANLSGNYSIPLQAGIHKITPILENSNHFEISPSSITVTFPHTSDTITQDFCITPKGIFRQTNITVIPLSPPARPGFDAQYKIVWENVGNQIESGTLNFTYDETLLDYISATQAADQVADGIIKWNFTNLLPFEKREIIVTLKLNRPTDTPAVNAGDKLYLTASILDNIFTLENTVVGSYDPNDKTCLQGDRVKPDMVGEYVDYLIRFENTGNYAAENVVVKDIIDTKTLDVSTLKITDASHEVYTRIEGNKVEFIFENIQLPFDDANNDGYIAFKIKTLPSLILGDSFKNLADIYFDYNFPIRTNEAQTTVAFPVFTKDITTEVKFYPNPVTDILYLDKNDHWTKAEIFDIAGRIMRSISLNGPSMDVSGLESGTYFVRLKDGEKVGLVKFVKI